MATIDEIVDALQSTLDDLNRSIAAAGMAETAAGDLSAQMAAVGVQDKAAEFGGVKDAVEKARVYLGGGADLVDDAINLAKAAGG